MADLQMLQEELEALKEKCAMAEKNKTELIIQKVDAQEQKAEAQKRLTDLIEKQKSIEEDRATQDKLHDREINDLNMKNVELKEKNNRLEQECQAILEILKRLEEEMQIQNKLPEKNINFTGKSEFVEDDEETSLDISSVCFVTLNQPFVLERGQALITFEDEKVAKQVIQKKKHNITIDDDPTEVKALPVVLKRTVKFEVNMNISTKRMRVCNLPTDLNDECIKDKLELAFYKSNIGGGEVEKVEYERESNTAYITFRDNGVVQNVIKQRQHEITANGFPYEVSVQPCVNLQLKKLQMFTGISPKTVLLNEVNSDGDNEEEVQDAIEIHFQKPSNGGGEVEKVVFNKASNKMAHFENDMN
ncbi:N-myc-interactor [Discoglossus pictus]